MEKVMNMGYLENAYFNDMATDVYIAFMTFVMTVIVLISLKDLRWETQSIYFFYFSALNEDRAVNFLRLRTVLIEGVQRFALDNALLQKAIDKLLTENSVYGKVFKVLNVEDKVAQLSLERDLHGLADVRDHFQNPRVNSLSKWLMPNEAKSQFAYEARATDIQQRLRELNPPVKSSGYAFACFSNFEVVAKFKKYGKR